jgi:hypothetical protein
MVKPSEAEWVGNLQERSLAIYLEKFERLYRNINVGIIRFLFSRILSQNLKFDITTIVRLGCKFY